MTVQCCAEVDTQNTIIVISFAHGIDTVTDEFSISIDYIRNGTTLPQTQRNDIRRYLGRLSLEPRYVSCVACLMLATTMSINT